MDRNVFVKGTQSTSLLLPFATGYWGKEVVVVNGNSGAVQVSPITGEIMPGSPQSVGANTTARFISDGVKTWQRTE